MKPFPVILLVTFFLLTITVAPTFAFGECSAVVQQALEVADATCAATGRNQVCNGYTRVEAQPRQRDDAFQFNPGDIANLTDIQSLRTYPLDTQTGEWGVALLRVQANLPDALPGSNSTFLLFGDAALNDASDAADVRPMQSVRLRTNVMGVSCEDAVLDGLLIQTPDDKPERVELTINGIPVSLGSTVLFQSEMDDTLTVTTLEGSAQLSVNGVELTVMPGESLTLSASTSLVQSEVFTFSTLEQLPLELLELPVMIHDALQGVQFEAAPDGTGGATSRPPAPITGAPTQIDWCQPGNPAGGTPPWAGQPGGRSAWERANCPNSPGTGNGNSSGNQGNGHGGGPGNGSGNNNGGGNGNGNGNGGGNGNGNGGGRGNG